jgi:hypothetical protein
MKKFKKIIAVLLMILILPANFYIFSCGGEKSGENESADSKTAEPNAAEEPIPAEEKSKYNVEDDLGEYDFGGYVFRNLAREGTNMDVEEEIGEVLNDAVYYRNRNVEERLNFKFQEKITPVSEYAAPMKNSILAGDKAYDIMVIRGPDAFAFASEGLLRPITDLPHIDFSKPYWDEWLSNQFTIAKKSFFAAGAYELETYSASAMLFNKSLAKDLGLEDFYALVRQGKWTFDKFEETAKSAKKDLDGDGVITAEDQHGFLGVTRSVQPAFWIAGGAKTINKDEDDIPYLSALEPRFIDVWLKMADILVKNETWFYNVSDPNLHPNPLWDTIFRDGRTLFLDGDLSSAQNLRDMEIDFGIIPFPKYDENQDKYYSQMAWIEILSIPRYAEDSEIERTGVILEALAGESYRKVTPVYVDIVLRSKYTRDNESEEMIDIIFENRIFDWGDTIWTPLLRDGIFPGIFIKKSDTVVSQLEKAQGNIQKTIDKMVESFMALDQ